MLQGFAGHARVVRVGEVGYRALLPADQAHASREVDRLHRVVHDEQFALSKRRHAPHGDLHLTPAGRTPVDKTGHNAPLHVQRAAGGQHLARFQGLKGLILQVQAHILHIRQVDNALLGLWKAVQLFAVADGLDIIKRVDIGPSDAGHAGRRPLLRAGPHAQVAIGRVKEALLQGILGRVKVGKDNGLHSKQTSEAQAAGS